MFFLLLSNRVIDNKISIGMIIILENIIKYFLDSYMRILSLFKELYKFRISKKRIDDLRELIECYNIGLIKEK